jgi:hypothetical protein
MSPLARRFVGRDSNGFKGKPYDLYEFVDTSPLLKADPSGEYAPPG